MNKIQWQEVTWYSKLVVLVLFVVLPFLGFYYGTQYGESVAYIRSSAALTPTTLDYYHNVAAWQTTSDAVGAYSIAYPLDFPFNQGALTIPSVFEPQTNFADAKLMVSHSGGAIAVANCFAAPQTGSAAQPTSTAMIGGTEFTVFYSSDAGAGNLYDTTSYRTLHGSQCYTIEYTIHSSQLANYPSQYQLNPVNKAKIIDVMNRIVGTFKFL